MTVKLIAKTPEAKKVCQLAAGVCVGTNGSPKGLEIAIKSGHESVLEHASYTFLIEGVSRALLGQITRHRIASFSVESQRYCSYEDEDVIPHVVPDILDGEPIFEAAMESAMNAYKMLRQSGVPEEDARFVLPNATCTRMLATMNARELRHFFTLRCCNKAQWEIRDLANSMLELVKDEGLFDGAGAPCIRGKCPEIKSCGNAYA